MADKCCAYESYEDGAGGRSGHYGAYQDGSGGKGKGQGNDWSRADDGGTPQKQRTRRTMKKGKRR